jgi:hypothetical protein
MKQINMTLIVFLAFSSMLFGQFKSINQLTQLGTQRATWESKFSPKPTDTLNFSDYGGKLSTGIYILGGVGIPARVYIRNKHVMEFNFGYASVAFFGEDDEVKFYPGLFPGIGYSYFGDRFRKEKKRRNKIRAHGMSARVNQMFGEYSLTRTSLAWAMETFRESRQRRSFLFELGIAGTFPGDSLRELGLTDAVPGLHLRLQWNFFID